MTQFGNCRVTYTANCWLKKAHEDSTWEGTIQMFESWEAWFIEEN